VRHTWIFLSATVLTAPVNPLGAQISVRDRIISAIELPRAVDSVRKRGGIPEEEIRVVLEDARRRRIPAGETGDILKEADAAIRDHGPVDNFGAFVQSRLDAGLRGRALAQAIRQEHARRGIGKGKMRGSSAARERQDAATRARGTKVDERAKRPESSATKGRSARDTTKGSATKGKGRGRP
jgi:hypothetical protein